MPTNIRRMLSIIVALVTAIAFYFEAQAGNEFLKWFVLGLGALMIAAVWLFPETKRQDDS